MDSSNYKFTDDGVIYKPTGEFETNEGIEDWQMKFNQKILDAIGVFLKRARKEYLSYGSLTFKAHVNMTKSEVEHEIKEFKARIRKVKKDGFDVKKHINMHNKDRIMDIHDRLEEMFFYYDQPEN